MNGVLLSAALIVKNEEPFIGSCLASLKGVADEVIVVDTGSTDRSKEIAAGAGAKVYEFPWTGDFSAARNRALEFSSGAWILYIDADEQVRFDSTADLRSELLDPAYAGYRVSLHPSPGYTSYWTLRLFKNDPTIRFSGVIHESTWPALNEYRARHGGEIGRSSMVMDHAGYEGDQSAKHRRNLPLLLEYLRNEPDRVYCWCHLANIYTATEEHQLAEEAWQNALAVVRKNGVRAAEDLLPYVATMETLLKRGVDVSELFDEASARFPGSVQLDWVRGQMLFRQKQYHEAIAVFERLVARGRTGKFDHLSAYDTRLFGVLAYDAIATCYFRMGRYAESGHYYDLAAQQEPSKIEYRAKRALAANLERKTGLLASA